MIVQRTWAMSNRYTFSIKPIAELLERYIVAGATVVDPFANNSQYGTITNDINPACDTHYHMDALEFLKMLPSNSADCVLYDPPYSLRQVSECYKGFGYEVTQETTRATWRSRHLDEIQRILKDGGVAICFGWNSNGVGKKRGFEMKEILLVAHGGSKNDTIVTVEQKNGERDNG